MIPYQFAVIAPKTNMENPTSTQFITSTQAREIIFERITPLNNSERVPLSKALGRRLSEDIVSPVDVPAYTNSALDGYAFSAREIPDFIGPVTCKVSGESLAGHPYTGDHRRNEVVRVMTGAPIPEGLDTVIMQEETQPSPHGDTVVFDPKVVRGRTNVRLQGEDIRKGSTVLLRGTLLTALHLALLASLGLAFIPVLKKVRVGIIATGDELIPIGTPCPENRIFNSNGPALVALCNSLGCKPNDYGIVADKPELIRAALDKAFSENDLVLVSGGASNGDADYSHQILAQEGSMEPWLIKMRPGKPMRFGVCREKPFFVLPGNPVALVVTFLEFVRYSILLLAGCSKTQALPSTFEACSTADLKKKEGREEFSRGKLSISADGQMQVAGFKNQGPAAVSGLATADCILVLAKEAGAIKQGDTVEVQRLQDLLS